MKSSILFPFLLFLIVIIFQSVIVPFLSFDGVAPDMILILLIYYTINNSQMYGTLLGSVLGIISDLTFGSILGSMMVTKTISGFVAGYFSSENKRDTYLKPINFSLIVLFVSAIHNFVFSFFSTFDLSENFFYSLISSSALSSLYTSLIGFLIIIVIPRRRTFE
jgi:rod shape-determining protein MreD